MEIAALAIIESCVVTAAVTTSSAASRATTAAAIVVIIAASAVAEMLGIALGRPVFKVATAIAVEVSMAISEVAG